eukprot:g187.t1
MYTPDWGSDVCPEQPCFIVPASCPSYIHYKVDKFYRQNETYRRLRMMKRAELLRRGRVEFVDVNVEGNGEISPATEPTPSEPTHNSNGNKIIGSIDLKEEKEFEKFGSNSVYGEISPSSVANILNTLFDAKQDYDRVMYDLGSGLGRVILQSALSSKIKKLVGVELSRTRYEPSCNALKNMTTHYSTEKCREEHKTEEQNLLQQKISFVNGDILRYDITDGTLIYLCATTWPYSLIQALQGKFTKLKPNSLIVTFKPFISVPPYNSSFVHNGTINVKTSWHDNITINVYKVIDSLEKRHVNELTTKQNDLLKSSAFYFSFDEADNKRAEDGSIIKYRNYNNNDDMLVCSKHLICTNINNMSCPQGNTITPFGWGLAFKSSLPLELKSKAFNVATPNEFTYSVWVQSAIAKGKETKMHSRSRFGRSFRDYSDIVKLPELEGHGQMSTDNDGTTWVLPILELKLETYMGPLMKIGPFEINIGPGGTVEIKPNYPNSKFMLVSQFNTVADGVWHPIAISGRKLLLHDDEIWYDIAIYIDGKKATSGRLPFIDMAANKKEFIVLGDPKFNGYIDELIIYNSALSESDIATLSHIPFWGYHDRNNNPEAIHDRGEKVEDNNDADVCKGTIIKRCPKKS